jgi:hypothetical protein
VTKEVIIEIFKVEGNKAYLIDRYKDTIKIEEEIKECSLVRIENE